MILYMGWFLPWKSFFLICSSYLFLYKNIKLQMNFPDSQETYTLNFEAYQCWQANKFPIGTDYP